ncbi:hypothetical protein VVR12_03365 [Rothia sp. LK2588]
MNQEQLEAKVAYLTQEVNQLRDALLDARILAGDIKLANTTEKES